jgi:hypothetical protein
MAQLETADLTFLRSLPVDIVTMRGKKPTATEAAIIQRAMPFWTAGYVTEKARVDNIGRVVLRIALTEIGLAAIEQPS